MSERGSFVTEYIYCAECMEAATRVLVKDPAEKYLCAVAVPHWNEEEAEIPLPIIAGKIGGGYDREEIVTFTDELIPELEPLLCHSLTIAVLPDSGEPQIFVARGMKKPIEG